MSATCRVCNRPLTDPVSVRLGIGPVCRGGGYAPPIHRRRDSANYTIVEDGPDVLVIKDIGPWDMFMTITNAAEAVVAELAPRLRGRRLEYIDSDGRRDQLVVKDGRFMGFAPGRAA